MSEPTLTVREGYLAMYAFLESLYRETESDYLGGLLGGMSLLPDGSPADPAVWPDWLDAVVKATCGEVNADFRISK